MEYTIRPMTKADWQRTAEIYRQGIATNKATFQCECPDYRDWDASHLDICRLVITKHNTVVGWAALSSVSDRAVYAGVAEVSIYVDTDYAGEGLGARLLTELIASSEENGIWTLQSGIMRDNTVSIRMHEKCGFRIVGYRENIGCDRFGCWRDTVLMERRSRVAGMQGASAAPRPRVAFICVHNSCRSQIAQALGKLLAADVFDSYSAGTEKKPCINQDAVRLMKQLYGIDMEKTQYSKLLTDIPPVDIVITMGCNVECPYLPCNRREDWGLDDPTGKSDAEFLKVIHSVKQYVLELKKSLI